MIMMNMMESRLIDKEFLEQHPNCPNPNHYPISAEFYIITLKYSEDRKCNDE